MSDADGEGIVPSSEYIDSLGPSQPFTKVTPGTSKTLSGGRVSPNAQTGVLISNCSGKTDKPHKSGIYASVHGRTTCTSFNGGGLSVQTTIYRQDWWGWNSMATDYSSRASGTTSQDAHPHADCGGADTHTYRGFSSHNVYKDGVRFYAETWYDSSFSCR